MCVDITGLHKSRILYHANIVTESALKTVATVKTKKEINA